MTELEEGGMFDEETMPDWMKTMRGVGRFLFATLIVNQVSFLPSYANLFQEQPAPYISSRAPNSSSGDPTAPASPRPTSRTCPSWNASNGRSSPLVCPATPWCRASWHDGSPTWSSPWTTRPWSTTDLTPWIPRWPPRLAWRSSPRLPWTTARF